MRIKSLLIERIPYSIISMLLLLLLGLPWLAFMNPVLPYYDRPCDGLGLYFYTILSFVLTFLSPPDPLLDSPTFPLPDVTLGLGDLCIWVYSYVGLICLTTLRGTPSNWGNFMLFSNSLLIIIGFWYLTAYWEFIEVFNCSLWLMINFLLVFCIDCKRDLKRSSLVSNKEEAREWGAPKGAEKVVWFIVYLAYWWIYCWF